MNDFMQNAIPDPVQNIIETLNRSGYEAYIVGGCVRDLLMGLEPKDWDIATAAQPHQVKALFPKTVDTGIAHGTVTVVLYKQGYEVTTFRIDGAYTDGRRPDSVAYTSDLVEDLARRDFTINALAFHKDVGCVDHFGGMEDLQARIIRGVGEPAKRFQEDALRMLRAVRFSAQLGFTIEPATYQAIVDNAHLIKQVSIERVRDEVLKIILSDRPQQLSLLVDTGLLEHLCPQAVPYLAQHGESLLNLLPECPKTPADRLGMLFLHVPGKDTQQFLSSARMDNKTAKEAAILSHWLNTDISEDAYTVRKVVGAIGHDHLTQVLQLKAILHKHKDSAAYSLHQIEMIQQSILKNKDCCTLAQLDINGEALKRLGIETGRHIGQVLCYLLDETMKDPGLNNHTKLEEMALQHWLSLKED